ncbi:MAG: glycosyltransferase [Sciscionella sp.]
MSARTVALIAAGTDGGGAVSSRIAAMAGGLRRRGWDVDIHDVAPMQVSAAQRVLDRSPAWARARLERLGIEGDVTPSTVWRAQPCLAATSADIAIVSVPPFSLLAAGVLALPPGLPWIADYRDPWSARAKPSPLARFTRHAERIAVAKCAAVTFAGGSRLADLLAARLHVSRGKIVSVPNGHDPSDVAGLTPHRPRTERNGTPLDLVFGGYWYGRNGPGILPDALARVGARVAQLTVIGDIAPSVEVDVLRAIGDSYRVVPPMPRPQLYQRLAHADAAIIPLDSSSAIESRIPAKVYDCLATGVPIIALCPGNAALLRVPGGERIHHIAHRDTRKLAELLAGAADDRSALRSGPLRAGTTRDVGVERLDRLLRSVCEG